jgi:hypothetical protein
MTIELVGKDFSDFLINQKISLTEHSDGRIQSLMSEENLTELLREQFKDDERFRFLPKDDNRAFGDIDIEIDGAIHHINVKMVDPEKSSTYNAGGVQLFGHLLFNYKNYKWEKLCKEVKSNEKKELKGEYYYLIYYKNSMKPPVFVKFSEISRNSITTNPSNPLQLKSKGLKTKKRNTAQSYEFVVGLLEDFMEKRAKPYLILKGEQ